MLKCKYYTEHGYNGSIIYRNWKVQIHRYNLPAIINNKFKCWYERGSLHRDNDLPAVEYANGERRWYRNGLLHRDNDLPAVEHINGDRCWYRNGQLHRDNDLPAVERVNGIKYWYRKGERYTPFNIRHMFNSLSRLFR